MKKGIINKLINSNITYYTVLFIIPILILYYQNMTPLYYNNDDYFLQSIASGEFSGSPSSHLVHIGYFTGLLLSSLYNLLPSIPWYGIVIFGAAYLSIIVSFGSLLKYTTKWWHKILLTGSSLILIYAFLFTYLLQIQYTTVTSIVCVAAMIQFYHTDEQTTVGLYIRKQIPSLIFLFLSLEIRNKACIMFLPMFFLLIVGRYLHKRFMRNALFAYGCLVLGLLLLTLSIEKIAYSSESWNTFAQYNSDRESIVDYGGYPSYEEHQETYEALGISYPSYVATEEGYLLLLDSNINAEFMHTIKELSPTRYSTIEEIVNVFIGMHIDFQFGWPINQIVFVLYAIVFLLAIICHKKNALFDLLSVFIGRNIIWVYVLFIQRPIPRITEGIYIAEFLLLIAILVKQQLWSPKDKKWNIPIRLIAFILLLGALALSIKSGFPFAKRINDRNIAQSVINHAYEEAFEYMSQNQENFYLLDVYSFLNLTEPVFAPTNLSPTNYTYLGGWTANSPWTDAIAANNGFSSYEQATLENENVYFTFLDSTSISFEYLENYYADRYPHISLEIQDSFTTSNGSRFLFLQCKTK